MSRTDDDIDWSLTTWEGSRRAQLRQWLSLSVRERLQAIEELADLEVRLAGMLSPTKPATGLDPPSAVDGTTGDPEELPGSS